MNYERRSVKTICVIYKIDEFSNHAIILGALLGVVPATFIIISLLSRTLFYHYCITGEATKLQFRFHCREQHNFKSNFFWEKLYDIICFTVKHAKGTTMKYYKSINCNNSFSQYTRCLYLTNLQLRQ